MGVIINRTTESATMSSIQADRMINRMNRFRHIIQAMGDAVHEDEAVWKPNDHDWSVVEILSHMVDTEIEDMRTRLRLTLEDPSQPWPGIDPEGWAIQRRYAENDFRQTIDRFVRERTLSVDWLRSLREPDWNAEHTHPKFGSMRAGDILAAWCAHDSLHHRQIAKRLFQLTTLDAGPFRTEYAGTWKA